MIARVGNNNPSSTWDAVAGAIGGFLDGSRAFNSLNLFFTVTGLVLGIIALRIALDQLKKTANAAQAAQRAAEATRRKLFDVANYVSMQRVCSLAGEAALAIRVNDRGIASIRLNDLRVAAAQIRTSDSQSNQQQERWQTVMTQIASAEASISARYRNGTPKKGTQDEAMRLITDIQQTLHELSAAESRKLGDLNAVIE